MHGITGAIERQHVINCFNAPDSPNSVALICIKWLWVGTNIATADTVIASDSYGSL
jgi:hypothetical protein